MIKVGDMVRVLADDSIGDGYFNDEELRGLIGNIGEVVYVEGKDDLGDFDENEYIVEVKFDEKIWAYWSYEVQKIEVTPRAFLKPGCIFVTRNNMQWVYVTFDDIRVGITISRSIHKILDFYKYYDDELNFTESIPNKKDYDIMEIWYPKAINAYYHLENMKKRCSFGWTRGEDFKPLFVCGIVHEDGVNKHKTYLFESPVKLCADDKVIVDTKYGKQPGTVKWCTQVMTKRELDSIYLDCGLDPNKTTSPLRKVLERRIEL